MKLELKLNKHPPRANTQQNPQTKPKHTHTQAQITNKTQTNQTNQQNRQKEENKLKHEMCSTQILWIFKNMLFC